MSAFAKWFIEQHGPRSASDVPDATLRERVDAGRAAERELRSRQTYDRMLNSALYAWNVSDADKTSK